MLETIRQPWPWYIAGPLIGLTVPVLLIIGILYIQYLKKYFLKKQSQATLTA